MSSVLSLPPQFYNGNFDKGDVVVGPLVESRNIPLVEGLGIVVCGSEDDLEVLSSLKVLTNVSLMTRLNRELRNWRSVSDLIIFRV